VEAIVSAILVGIDEAGYGPILGPLVVSGTAFQVPADPDPPCLWQRLGRSVTQRVSRRDSRLAIADSKKLYNRKTGLAALERAALTVLRTNNHTPASFRDLLQVLCPHLLAQLEQYPWYRAFDTDVPVSIDPAGVAIQANALARDCREHDIEPLWFRSEVLLEGHFNRLVGNTRNKAVVLLGLVLRIVNRLMDERPGVPLRICVDRQGGRLHYTAQLLTAFRGFDLQVLEESPARSAYALRSREQEVRLEFVAEGESHYLPIALASIFSKYLRELFMQGLNRYWQQRVEHLRPTAGYYRDGQRFLDDITGAVEETGVDRALLVRSR
jgi:hypothetical protein